LTSTVLATVLIIRRAPLRGFLVAALILGSVGVVCWMVSLALLPATMVSTVSINR